MTLHAILSFYDESPSWLAGCITSLTRIGIDHLIAVDGRYPHFMPTAPACSRPEQIDAITSSAMGANMALTLHRPIMPMLEPTKRTLAFQLLNAVGEYGDWLLVIDADERVSEGTLGLRNELAMIDENTHVVACRVTNAIDPYAAPGPDNDVNTRTQEIHHKLPVSMQHSSKQSRFWRVLNDMRVEVNHYTYTGVDRAGVRWNLRPDIGSKTAPNLPKATIAGLDLPMTIEHRKNSRTFERRVLKDDYYSTRDELGLELA